MSTVAESPESSETSGVEHISIYTPYRSPLASHKDSTTLVSGMPRRKAVFPPPSSAPLPAGEQGTAEECARRQPTIQYGVEEALASGVDNVILVTGRGKNAIEDHFDVNMELEAFLEKKGKQEQLDAVRAVSNLINFAYVRQGEPLGLGHAVLVTRALVGDEPPPIAGYRRRVRREPTGVKR